MFIGTQFDRETEIFLNRTEVPHRHQGAPCPFPSHGQKIPCRICFPAEGPPLGHRPLACFSNSGLIERSLFSSLAFKRAQISMATKKGNFFSNVMLHRELTELFTTKERRLLGTASIFAGRDSENVGIVRVSLRPGSTSHKKIALSEEERNTRFLNLFRKAKELQDRHGKDGIIIEASLTTGKSQETQINIMITTVVRVKLWRSIIEYARAHKRFEQAAFDASGQIVKSINGFKFFNQVLAIGDPSAANPQQQKVLLTFN